jgi:hypothetical protein
LNGRLWSTKEGVGETSGQTAGSQVSTEFALSEETVRQKNLAPAVPAFFIRCGAPAPQFRRRCCAGPGFAPDVFADALVLLADPSGRGNMIQR